MPQWRNKATRTALILCLLVVCIVEPALAKSYTHPLIEQTYTLLPNGDAQGEEVRTFRFDGSFSWAELARSLRGQYGSYTIQYQAVEDADTGEPQLFSADFREGSRILRWSSLNEFGVFSCPEETSITFV